MFNGSNSSELGSQLRPAFCASLEGTHSLLNVGGGETSLMEILGGEIQEGFREELTVENVSVSAKLLGFPLLGREWRTQLSV